MSIETRFIIEKMVKTNADN